jgi:hypothetical protein
MGYPVALGRWQIRHRALRRDQPLGKLGFGVVPSTASVLTWGILGDEDVSLLLQCLRRHYRRPRHCRGWP